MFLHGEPEKISRKDQRFTLARSKSLSAEFWIWDLPAHHLHTHTPSTQSQIKTTTTILQTDTTCTCSNLVRPSSFHPPFLMLTKTKTRDMFAICCFHPFLHFQTWFVNVCQFLDFPTPSIWWSFVYQLWSKSSSFFLGSSSKTETPKNHRNWKKHECLNILFPSPADVSSISWGCTVVHWGWVWCGSDSATPPTFSCSKHCCTKSAKKTKNRPERPAKIPQNPQNARKNPQI